MNHRTDHAILRSSAVALCIAGLPSAAMASWSAGLDFSFTENPAGVWSYGTRAAVADTSFLLLSDPFVNGSSMGWRDNFFVVLGAPAVWKDSSGSADVLRMHPGPAQGDGFGSAGSREFAVTRWTAPTSSLFDIGGSFVALSSGSTDVHIVLNGVSLFSTIRASNTNAAFSLSGVAVSAGDTIDFVVGNNGSFFFDTTGLVATIVPAPAAAAPLALALLALRRRRR